MAALEKFGNEFWIASGPIVATGGFRYPTRMAVIRLADGGLFLWSPVALTEDLRSAVDALGPVRFIVQPNALHYLFLQEWKVAFPQALLFAAPGGRARSKTIAFDGELADGPAPGWAGQIDQVLMHGNLIATEAVFFHRQSGVVLITDLIQSFPPGWFSGWRGLVARLDRMTASPPETPNKFRVAFVARKRARARLTTILSWPAQKVLIAHGDPIEAEGAAFLARAFAWLGGPAD